jgi:phage portal protein BeeE
VPTLVGRGDRIVTLGGRESWLKRPSVSLSAYAGGGHVSLSGNGTVSYQRLYESQPFVATAVNKLYRQILRLPLKVYQLDDDGNRERVRDHPVADLLANPWPRGDAIHLKQRVSLPVLLHGNALIAKVRGR